LKLEGKPGHKTRGEFQKVPTEGVHEQRELELTHEGRKAGRKKEITSSGFDTGEGEGESRKRDLLSSSKGGVLEGA